MLKAISRLEVNLLRVLRGLVEQVPAQRILPMLVQPLPRPKCLSRDAVELVRDTLAKGCVRWLARHGWMRQRFLSNGKAIAGRLWERTSPHELGLTFSAHSLEFLLQLVSGTLGARVPKLEELTVGDRLLLCLSFNVLRKTEPGEKLRLQWLLLHQDGLCRLAFLEELHDGNQPFRIDWQTWTTGLGASILEAFQGWLAERWTEVESKKENIATVARMRMLGTTQSRVLGEYLDALAQAERRDLARCFLDTAHRLLRNQPTPQKWLRSLDVRKERLADRREIYFDAFAFLRQMERLHDWRRQAESVSYFDEGYAASQLWKADWERYEGDQMWEQASLLLREIK